MDFHIFSDFGHFSLLFVTGKTRETLSAYRHTCGSKRETNGSKCYLCNSLKCKFCLLIVDLPLLMVLTYIALLHWWKVVDNLGFLCTLACNDLGSLYC